MALRQRGHLETQGLEIVREGGSHQVWLPFYGRGGLCGGGGRYRYELSVREEVLHSMYLR